MQVMSKNIVHRGQSFLDKVIECTGSIENAFDMAIMNGIMITDDTMVGSELLYPKITNNFVYNFFTSDNRPATNIIIRQTSISHQYGFPYELPLSF